jgi:hypothetical protein
MQNQLKLLENEFKQELNELIGSGKFIDVQKAMSVCQLHLQKSKDFFLKNKSVSLSDEIYYFKHFKPKILAKIIYYKKITEIQYNYPLGNEEVRKNYINYYLQHGHVFFNQHNTLIKYYRNNQVNLDENFFVRENARLHSDIEHRFLSIDFTHSTGYDEILAEYIALEQVQNYLEKVQKDLDIINVSTLTNDLNASSDLVWTETKASLVEIIYGLHSVAAINKGKIEVKKIAFWFEKIFNLDQLDIYKTYAEIKNRKGVRTKFLDSLSVELNKRMNADDTGIS